MVRLKVYIHNIKYAAQLPSWDVLNDPLAWAEQALAVAWAEQALAVALEVQAVAWVG